MLPSQQDGCATCDVRWDAKDFRLNELAWRFWPKKRQFSTRVEVLTRLSEVAARYGLRVNLTGQPGVAAFLLGRLAETQVDAIELCGSDRSAPEATETARIMKDAGFRLVEKNATGSYFERSLRLVNIDDSGNRHMARSGTTVSRRITRPSSEAPAVCAAVSLGGLRSFLAHQILKGARYLRSRLSRPRIVSLLRRRAILYGTALLKALSLERYLPRFANRNEEITLDQFLSLDLIDDNELNTLVRQPHFDLITDDGRLRTIGGVVDFMKRDENMAAVSKNAQDPVGAPLSPYPRHLDRAFWENGNVFFLNCILSGFRCDVRPYEQIDSMLDERGEVLYSRQYYSRLPEMADVVIERLLRENPIEITNGAVSSGRHRVCAMIGHLMSGRQYLPFWASTA